ncbi:hypothetical protein [Aliivibrio fischeri]|uniref:hypothetical protein n=1 Tax=Aliivibrio fischeri TaxID=668 RepID=UPI0002F52C45|nr:hypothetical protein [Aliivibrio fischeri]KLU80625.1 hypothetical protein AB192_02030 [Aliivibrio fischeri]MUK24970.1 hypothetical protein [Aliivibrio fischeri]MUK32608.1 hypothetical protein [Aliivibrio fischeri]
MSNKTIICRSLQSFIDMCTNELVNGYNMHCTFELMPGEIEWMEDEFDKKGGGKLTVTKW